MRFLLIKILTKILYRYSPPPQKFDEEKVKEWLISLDSNKSGYKQYYTWRKRQLCDTMLQGIEQKEYWTTMGRYLELQYMNALCKQYLDKEEKQKNLFEEEKDEDKIVEGKIIDNNPEYNLK